MTSPRRLRVPPEIVQALRHMPPTLKRKLRHGLDTLLKTPEEGKALRAELEGLRSLAVGRFRIIYRLQGSILEIVAIGPRSTIYEATTRLVFK